MTSSHDLHVKPKFNLSRSGKKVRIPSQISSGSSPHISMLLVFVLFRYLVVVVVAVVVAVVVVGLHVATLGPLSNQKVPAGGSGSGSGSGSYILNSTQHTFHN